MGIDFTGSTLALVIVLFAVGLICIIKGGDLFVDAATWIAEASGIPKFIIGATVVSFATTMPEMLVSVFSAFEGNADIAVGNAVGSVTANLGLILGISALCMPALVSKKHFSLKAILMVAGAALLTLLCRGGVLPILPVCCLRRSCCCLPSRATVRCRFPRALSSCSFSSALWSRASLPQSASREARRPTSARAPTARALR